MSLSKKSNNPSFVNNFNSDAFSASSSGTSSSVSGFPEKNQQELKNLSLTTQPFRTLKFFIFAIYDYVKRLMAYLLDRGGWLLVFCILVVTFGGLLLTIEGPHEKHVEEFLQYIQFILWWIALGVASSIGLGYGLHTFVLYLGPHIALFTIKAMQCGRVDLKSAPYDTQLLKKVPTWLDKDCCDFGPPLFHFEHGERVSVSYILPQVLLEAILWGLGTALGELPPYFISRAASLSGVEANPIQELTDSSSEEKGVIGRNLKKVKYWLLSHSQYLNFFTILLLASVPNPLFDLAGIMCGQFGIPFWTFFLATLIGKAIIKTNIQAAFVIVVCNNQLLDWLENELIWVLSHIPGFGTVLPELISKLHTVRDKYLVSAPSVASNGQVKWGLSLASVWNLVVWLILVIYFSKIVNATAQNYLKKQQDMELKKK